MQHSETKATRSKEIRSFGKKEISRNGSKPIEREPTGINNLKSRSEPSKDIRGCVKRRL